MPQISVWTPTRTLAGVVADAMAAARGRPVRKNEAIHLGLMALALAPTSAGGAGLDAELVARLAVGELPIVENDAQTLAEAHTVAAHVRP